MNQSSKWGQETLEHRTLPKVQNMVSQDAAYGKEHVGKKTELGTRPKLKILSQSMSQSSEPGLESRLWIQLHLEGPGTPWPGLAHPCYLRSSELSRLEKDLPLGGRSPQIPSGLCREGAKSV